jgi:hypothetical protein
MDIDYNMAKKHHERLVRKLVHSARSKWLEYARENETMYDAWNNATDANFLLDVAWNSGISKKDLITAKITCVNKTIGNFVKEEKSKKLLDLAFDYASNKIPFKKLQDSASATWDLCDLMQNRKISYGYRVYEGVIKECIYLRLFENQRYNNICLPIIRDLLTEKVFFNIQKIMAA